MLLVAVLMASQGMAKLTGAPVESTIAMVILAFGVLAVVYAITMLALTVRSLLGVVVGGLAALVVCNAILFATVATMEFYKEGSAEEQVLLAASAVIGGLFVGIAAIATFLIWRRYLKLEWGHYLR